MSFRAEIMASIRSLPPVQEAHRKMLTLIERTDTDMNTLAQVIVNDPDLSACVMRRANEQSTVTPGGIDSLRQALDVLGRSRLYRLVVALMFVPLMNRDMPSYDQACGGLWDHSLAVAAAAEIIASIAGLTKPDGVIVAALLHDIGKIALAPFDCAYVLPADVTSLRADDIPFDLLERRELGIDHTEAGEMILQNWGVPVSLCIPVRWHHDPDHCPDVAAGRATDIVHLADSVCLTGGIGVGLEGLRYRLVPAVLDRLHIKKNMLEVILCRTAESLESFKENFYI